MKNIQGQLNPFLSFKQRIKSTILYYLKNCRTVVSKKTINANIKSYFNPLF